MGLTALPIPVAIGHYLVVGLREFKAWKLPFESRDNDFTET
jgi:hypothetical protein